MLESTKKYVYDRRKGLLKGAGYAGGLYLLSQYVAARIEDFREKIKQERAARENLRRRFEQNQEDMNFTVMTLVPTLGKHILQDMDVEALTHELQAKSKASKGKPDRGSMSSSVLSSSAEIVQEHDARSDLGSASILSYPDNGAASMGGSTHSWVDEFAAQTPSYPPRIYPDAADLSDSMLTTSSAPSTSANTESGSSEPASSAEESSASSSRSKAELWKEIKMLAFTRTLTVVYSLTLLTLFTQIQLTILGRYKYIQSVLQQERDERMREKLLDQVSISSLFWDPPDADEDVEEDLETVSRETERKFLTLSWWILHVGWKDVGERVKRGVEEVFEGVSLKSKLSAMDLHRLIGDVRRRVEHEITFEGTERRVNFASTLIPPTAETLQHVLLKGGVSPYASLTNPYPQSDPDPIFTALLAETRTLLSSSDFSFVLEVCLDRATEVLFDGLRKNVFVESGSGEEEVRIRLAGLLPGLARWSKLALTALPNELVDGLLGLREVTALSAIVFSKFGDRFR